MLLRCGRFGACRRSTLTCCRSVKFSASNFALDLKHEAKIPRISWNRSFIRRQAYPVCSLRPCRIEYSVHTGGEPPWRRRGYAADPPGSRAHRQPLHRWAALATRQIVHPESVLATLVATRSTAAPATILWSPAAPIRATGCVSPGLRHGHCEHPLAP
jgi:hypothetical protein